MVFELGHYWQSNNSKPNGELLCLYDMQGINVSKLTNCKACGNEIAKTANACPKCGAVNEWSDPRRDDLVKHLQGSDHNVHAAPWKFYGDRFSVWGETEMKFMSFEALRYALIAFVVGLLLNLFKSNLPMVVAGDGIIGQSLSLLFLFVQIIPYPIAIFFFGKWVYHSLITSNASDIMQKSFRVDYSADVPIWQSNDDEFWKPIKDYVMKNHVGSGFN